MFYSNFSLRWLLADAKGILYGLGKLQRIMVCIQLHMSGVGRTRKSKSRSGLWGWWLVRPGISGRSQPLIVVLSVRNAWDTHLVSLCLRQAPEEIWTNVMARQALWFFLWLQDIYQLSPWGNLEKLRFITHKSWRIHGMHGAAQWSLR